MIKSKLFPLLDANSLLQPGRIAEAAAALHRRLKAQTMPDAANAYRRHAPPTIDQEARRIPPFGAGATRPAMPEVLRDLIGTIRRDGLPGAGLGHRQVRAQPAMAVAEGAQFLSASFSSEAGTRPYRLYVPSGYHGQPVPLVVMLHGCTQSPDDFAAGTRMNLAAESQTCLVAYPGQTAAANNQKCWNWFNAGDQRRDGGEPSLIAGITRAVMRDYAVDATRVYVAGLSAGGAAAAIMGDAYPDLYAAIGVHSGLACGAARDVPSAFAAMQRGSDGAAPQARGRIVPAIVFHGDRDTTVSPRNAAAVVMQSARGAKLRVESERGEAAGGHTYSRSVYIDKRGRSVIEQWDVHGAGHVWFGGSLEGSYTDSRGPDATGEMLRFFLEHPHPEAEAEAEAEAAGAS